jgi:LmbE family N-acetylglucosaminyl deacetylase
VLDGGPEPHRLSGQTVEVTTMMGKGRVRQWLLVWALLLVFAPLGLDAQMLEGTGTVATGLLLRQMSGVKRVLMIGAHPDDEDTSLLTALARGWGVETAYLALSRGDGGQNLLGPELWEGLGVIRTGELQAARRLDGGRQFFTRAFDFGFSKTATETLAKWPEEDLLRDVVWIVRKFRPQVIVTVFTGTPADGHGQHQAAGMVAREAFEVAGDPSRFPDQLGEGVEAGVVSAPSPRSTPGRWIPSWGAPTCSSPWRAGACTAPRTWARRRRSDLVSRGWSC